MADLKKSDLNASFFGGIYENIKTASFNPKNSSSSEEIVNVLSDFAWRAGSSILVSNSFNSGVDSEMVIYGNLPFCIAIEREQTVTSSIANLLTLLSTISETPSDSLDKITKSFRTNNVTKNVAKNIVDIGSTLVGKPLATASDKLKEFKENNKSIEQIIKTAAGLTAKVTDITSMISDKFKEGFVNEKIRNSNLTNLLDPYSTMYYTKPTNKEFIFPYLTGDIVLDINNVYEDHHQGLLNVLGISDLIQNYSQLIGEGMADLANIIGGAVGNGHLDNYAIEMSKSYKFNTDGEEITVKFPLFNTIERDKWKNHYKFLYLFLLRNLPMKTGIGTYIPPLLYDFIIPGVKRLPISYVSKFSAAPQGMQRLMNVSGNEIPFSNIQTDTKSIFNNKMGSMAVIIPEAWIVSITFKSLLSKTMNTFLSSSLDLNITVSQ